MALRPATNAAAASATISTLLPPSTTAIPTWEASTGSALAFSSSGESGSSSSSTPSAWARVASSSSTALPPTGTGRSSSLSRARRRLSRVCPSSTTTMSSVFEAEFARYHDCHVGLMTHALHYGTGCFEGIRAYWNGDRGQLYLLQGPEHYQRLHRSARILR